MENKFLNCGKCIVTKNVIDQGEKPVLVLGERKKKSGASSNSDDESSSSGSKVESA